MKPNFFSQNIKIIASPLCSLLLGSLFFTPSFAMDQGSEWTPSSSFPNSTRVIGVPNRGKEYQPRENLALNTLFQNSNYVVLTQDASIPFGVGKTYLAGQYVNDFSNKYSHVLWFNATNESSLKKSLSEINYSLDREDQSIESFVKWVENTPGFLLVFDNVTNPQIVAPYCPNLQAPGHILITSRHTEWPEFKVVPVGLLSTNEGKSLFSKILRKPADQATEALVISLDHIPSLISEAGYFLKITNDNPKSYKTMMESEQAVNRRILSTRGKSIVPIDIFSGRKAYLAVLQEKILSSSSSTVILQGPPHAGKSALANEFAFQNVRNFKRLWNLPCFKEESLKTALLNIAKSLEISTDEQSTAVLLKAIYEKLSRQREKTLLIFDGLPHELAHLLPTFVNDLHSIVITESGDWNGMGHVLHLPPFTI